MNRKKNLTQSPVPNKDFVSAARDEVLDRVEKDYEELIKLVKLMTKKRRMRIN